MGEGILGCSCAPIGAVRAGPSHANKEEWGLEENGYLTPAWEACEPADTPARMSAAHANGSGSSASRASASSSTLDKGKGPATSSTATAADADLFDDAELDRIFNQEASQVAREAEVLRVLGAFKLNPYEILDLNWMPSAGTTDSDIQKTYRKKSLLIHPDKLKHPRGIEAFDLLKKAQTELSDPAKRKPLDETITDARMLVLRELGIPRETPDDDERLRPPKLPAPDLKERVRKKTKDLLIEDELRRRRVQKMTMIAEGAEAKRVEDAVAEKKRKMEEKERWEETREDRVHDWRNFNKKRKTKKKGPQDSLRAMADDDEDFELQDGLDDLDWTDPSLLAQLDGATQAGAAQGQGLQVPRASQIPPKPAPPPVEPQRLAQQQQRRPLAPPPPGPSQFPQSTQFPLGTARPGGILRPPQPPPRKRARVNGPPAAPAPQAKAVQDVDEDLPEIRVLDGGQLNGNGATTAGTIYRTEPERGTTIAFPPPPVPRPAAPAHPPVQHQHHAATTRQPSVQPAVRQPSVPPPVPQHRPQVALSQPQPLARAASESAAAIRSRSLGSHDAAGGTGMSEVEKRELEALRREKAKLQEALDAARKMEEELKKQVMTKSGENSIIRNRLSKAESAHALALKNEQRDKAQLAEQLEAKEREHKQALERFKIEEVFRRQELATAGPSSAQSQRHYHHPNHPNLGSAQAARFYSRGASAAPGASRDVPASPSLRRSSRAASERPNGVAQPKTPAPPAGPPPSTFSNFQNSFTAGSTAAAGKKGKARDGVEREGSMGPPKQAVSVGVRREAAVTTPTKRRRLDNGETSDQMLVEEDGQDLGGFEHGDLSMVQEEDEAIGGLQWEWLAEQRDTRSQLVAAVFTHTSLAPIDTEPAEVLTKPGTVPTRPATYAATHASTARATSSARNAHSSTFGGRSSTAAATAAQQASASQSSGPHPTFHALMNLRFPYSTPAALAAEYESITRDLFTLLGRRLDPHSSPYSSSSSSSTSSVLPTSFSLGRAYSLDGAHPMLEPLILAYGLASHFASLLQVLEAATLSGPMTALLKLMAHLAFLFPTFALACCAVTPAPSMRPNGHAATQQVQQSQAPVPLLVLLGRIIARYGRPELPSRDSLLPRGSGPAGSTLTTRPAAIRSRKARVARTSSASTAAKAEDDAQERVQLEKGKRGALLEAVLGVLEGVAWRCLAVRKGEEVELGVGEETRLAEESFKAFLQTPNAVATLLDPNHPLPISLASVRLLASLACRPPLFRSILGIKFYEMADVRSSRIPLVDRLATLLVMPRTDSITASAFDSTILTLASILLASHDDAIRLFAQSAAFVPELLAKMWPDVRTTWEHDGRDISEGGKQRAMLDRTVARLSRLIHLFYYLSLAPHSVPIAELLAGPSTLASTTSAGTAQTPQQAYQRQAVNDLFMACFGTVAFATLGGEAEDEGSTEGAMPSWAEQGSEQRRVLVELGYLAQEILEDVSPDELEEIEECFGLTDAEKDREEEAGEEADVQAMALET
ncbi:J domain-containing protein spf31 [Rhodotorula toruloides]|nr:J domain-containing protein spf31 [Rhodotorula toruloides]